MQTLTDGGLFRGKWIKFHVRLRTSSDWARLEVPGLPYLLAVEDPAEEAAKADALLRRSRWSSAAPARGGRPFPPARSSAFPTRRTTTCTW